MGAHSYRGRFSPSPTGPLHAGSLVAALASWLDARAHQGRWLVRIEDVDQPRSIAGADRLILAQLAACALVPDEPPVWQSQRTAFYQQALDQLIALGLAYPCNCSRKNIEAALLTLGQERPRHGELIYPGTCRTGMPAKNQQSGQNKPEPAWRLRSTCFEHNVPIAPANKHLLAIKNVACSVVCWTDRRRGEQQQNVAAAVGDFVLKRADGCFTYQLAVVVDDAAQGITQVVRGEDLADNTARQVLLQQALGLPTPGYLHSPLVLGTNGEKLSKQNGAQALHLSDPLAALNQASNHLGLPPQTGSVPDALAAWVGCWKTSTVLTGEV